MGEAAIVDDLAALHRDRGARWTEWAGRPVVAGFGDLEDELAALRAGRALLDRSAWDVVSLGGADRHRFLGGLVTCEVKGLEPGQSRYGFFTAREGKVLADVTVVAREEELVLDLSPGTGDAIAEHLGKYLIADRVEIRRPPIVAFTLLGAAGVEGAPPDDAEPSARALYGVPSHTLWVAEDQAARRWLRLVEEGWVPIGVAALEEERIGRGVARLGQDFGPENLPQETGLEDVAVSYTKGCYLGQEVVARLHYRGKPQRMLRGLRLPAGAPPTPGTEVLFAGRPLGTLTSVTSARGEDAARGLAILHRRGAAAGTRVELAGGGTAVVCELPFGER